MNILPSTIPKFNVQYHKHFEIILHHVRLMMLRKDIKKFDLNYLHLTLSDIIEKNSYKKHVERINANTTIYTPDEKKIYKILTTLRQNIIKYYTYNN